jgi:hypothetical protein
MSAVLAAEVDGARPAMTTFGERIDSIPAFGGAARRHCATKIPTSAP